jgi:hypothetical protein
MTAHQDGVAMSNTAGSATRRSGWQRAKSALLTPQVLLILAFVLVLVIGAVLGVDALLRAIGVHTNNTADAALFGAAVTGTLLVLGGEVVVLAGGVNWITGGFAERSTGDALAVLGPEWRIIHNLPFTIGDPPDTWEVDVDHVAVGPYGVLVVETKYSSVPVNLDAVRLPKQVRKDAEQAARNGTRIRGLLANGNVPMTTLLVYWGWRLKGPQHPVRKIGRVHAVLGNDAERWIPTFSTRMIERELEDTAWSTLQKYQAEHPTDSSASEGMSG